MKYHMGSVLSVVLMIDEYEKMNGRRCRVLYRGYSKLPAKEDIVECKSD